MIPKDDIDLNKERKEAMKIIQNKEREYEMLKNADASRFKEVALLSSLKQPQPKEQQQEDPDLILERLNNLKDGAKDRGKGVFVQSRKLNTFSPISAEECKTLTFKLKENKAAQKDKLKNIDITDLSKEYEKMYMEFNQNLQKSDTRIVKACGEIAQMHEYSQILRDIPPPTELYLWNKDDITPQQRTEIDKLFEQQRKKFQLKEEPEDYDVSAIIAKGKEYFNKKYKLDQIKQ